MTYHVGLSQHMIFPMFELVLLINFTDLASLPLEQHILAIFATNSTIIHNFLWFELFYLSYLTKRRACKVANSDWWRKSYLNSGEHCLKTLRRVEEIDGVVGPTIVAGASARDCYSLREPYSAASHRLLPSLQIRQTRSHSLYLQNPNLISLTI